MAKKKQDLAPLMEAAARLHLSYQVTRDRALRGIIPGLVRRGRNLFIERAALNRYARQELARNAKAKSRTSKSTR